MKKISHSFNVEIATHIGIEKAIMLQHFYFWHQRNRANEQHFHDGKYWTYNTAKSFSSLFPYITTQSMYRLLKKMESDGLVVTGNFNQTKFDRTKWYALTDKSISMFENAKHDFSKTENGISESDEPIPYIKPNGNTDINTDDSENPKSLDGKIHQLLVKSFSIKYEKISGAKFQWDGKQTRAIKLLIPKIRKSWQTAENPIMNPSGEQMVDVFEHIMELALTDSWMSDNFEPAILNSKYNNFKLIAKSNRNLSKNEQIEKRNAEQYNRFAKKYADQHRQSQHD